MNPPNNFSSAAQDLAGQLTLNKLKEWIEPFRDMKILVAITCRPEFYDYLANLPEMKTETGFGNVRGPNVYVIHDQEETIKYWYNNQEKELKEYLKNNI